MSYGKVHETFWTDKKVRGLSDDGKMLALYLLTGPHRNILGCMRIPDGYLVADLGWNLQRVKDAIRMLCECHFICRDDDGWTLILNQLKHDPIKVPNHAVAAVVIANTVPPDSVVYQQLVPRLTAALDAIGKASLWHPHAIAIPEPSPLPEPSPSPGPAYSVPNGTGADAPPDTGDLEGLKKASYAIARKIGRASAPTELLKVNLSWLEIYAAMVTASSKTDPARYLAGIIRNRGGPDDTNSAAEFLRREIERERAGTA